MANKDQEEKLDVTPDEGVELSEEQMDGIAGGRWRGHPPTQRERHAHEAIKRRQNGQYEPYGQDEEGNEGDLPQEALDYN